MTHTTLAAPPFRRVFPTFFPMARPFREDLVAWRARHNLTQDEAAERLGVAVSSVRRWEGGGEPSTKNRALLGTKMRRIDREHAPAPTPAPTPAPVVTAVRESAERLILQSKTSADEFVYVYDEGGGVMRFEVRDSTQETILSQYRHVPQADD